MNKKVIDGVATYLSVDSVHIAETAEKTTLLNEMVDTLGQSPVVHDVDALRAAIHYRESLMSTGIGMGIAIPHVRIDEVDDLTMCAALVRQGVEAYDSLDDQQVKLVFMMAAHSDQHSLYLKTLSRLSSMLKDEAFRNRLFLSADPEEFLYFLRQEEER